jgi:hypothetical protein
MTPDQIPGFVTDDQHWHTVADPADLPAVPAGTAVAPHARGTAAVAAPVGVVGFLALLLLFNAWTAVLWAAGWGLLYYFARPGDRTPPAVEAASPRQVARTDFLHPDVRDLADRAVAAFTTLAASNLTDPGADGADTRKMLMRSLYHYLDDLRGREAAGGDEVDIPVEMITAVADLEDAADRASGLTAPVMYMPAPDSPMSLHELVGWIDAFLSDNHA